MPEVEARLAAVRAAQRVKSADRRHDEAPRDERGDLVVGELPQRPLVQEIGAQIGDHERAIGRNRVTDWMLHERIGHEDEVGRQPAADGYANRGQEMFSWTELVLSPDQ